MTGTVTKPSLRRAVTVVSATVGLSVGAALLAGPASAEVPVGWGTQEPVDKVFVLGVLVGLPILLFVLITAAVYLPGLVRGERVAPGATGPEDQWLGGRRTAGEIETAPAADSGDSAQALEKNGGAGARW